MAIRTHAWTTRQVDKGESVPLRYADVQGVNRLCTITETWCAAIVSHIVGVMASAGMPDFPGFEKNRINQILSQ